MSWFSYEVWQSMPDVERDIFDYINSNNLPGYDALDDNRLYHLVEDALFSEGAGTESKMDEYRELEQYLDDYYGLDIDDVVDWEDYRAWYSE